MVSFNHWLSSIKPIRCQGIKRWLTLTMLRATGPWTIIFTSYYCGIQKTINVGIEWSVKMILIIIIIIIVIIIIIIIIIITGNPCTPSADSHWSLVGNWECLQYHLQRMRRTAPMPAEQRPRPNLPPGSPTAQVQVGIKITARQITIAGETGWRGPRQDPQMAKRSWPQARNRGLYHRSSRSKPLNTLVPTEHPQEAWRGPKM